MESSLVIRCRKDGPLVVQRPVTIVDHEGRVLAIPGDKPLVALCRCGHSQRKPFCDGTHRVVGFRSEESDSGPAASDTT
jgi:CDGSH-type Zn-finger protein